MWKRPMLSAVLILRVAGSRSGSKSTIGVGLPSRPTGVLLFLVDCVARSSVAQVVCVPGWLCCAVLLARSWWVCFLVVCSLLTAGARGCPAGDA